MKYMKCKYSKSRNRDKEIVRFDSQEILNRGNFWYLKSIIHKNYDIETDVNYRIKAWRMK